MEPLILKSITLEDAMILGKNALKIAKEKGYNISVTIVDCSGNVKLILKSDQANYITPESSRKKAYTACAMRMPTIKLIEMEDDNPNIIQLSKVSDSIIIYGGGRPIVFEGETVGAIGIAGAPGGGNDDKIAFEALCLMG